MPHDDLQSFREERELERQRPFYERFVIGLTAGVIGFALALATWLWHEVTSLLVLLLLVGGIVAVAVSVFLEPRQPLLWFFGGVAGTIAGAALWNVTWGRRDARS